MKLAVSNIAWTKEEEPVVARTLQRLGVKYIEIAPTKQWQDPTVEAKDSELAAYKDFWGRHGIEIVAFQSMLFNRPDLKIFGNEPQRLKTRDYLQHFISLAPKLGAGIMVFGSPKNRQRGYLPIDQAEKIAKEFFASLGHSAQRNDTVFCIEPNPPDYGCDFITTARQGIDLVGAVDSPGFGLHLDIAGMTLAGDDVQISIKEAGAMLQHLHISVPFLEQVEERNDIDYAGAASALKMIGYDRYVSIEMKPGEAGTNVERIEKAIHFAQGVFI